MKAMVGLMLLLVLAGCALQPVTVDYAPDANFSAIQRYAWASQGAAAFGNANDGLMDQRVQAAVMDEFRLRGIRFDAQTPDIYVGYQVRKEEKVDVYRYPGFYSHRHRHHHALPFYDEVIVYRYTLRLFTLDVMDSAHRLIWRGVYRDSQRPGATPDEREARIREKVAEVLVNFPR